MNLNVFDFEMFKKDVDLNKLKIGLADIKTVGKVAVSVAALTALVSGGVFVAKKTASTINSKIQQGIQAAKV